MFILYQKRQLIYPEKVNSPPIRQFPSFSIFGHVTCHVTIINGYVTRRPQDLLLVGKKFMHLVLALLAKDITNQSYSPNTLNLCQALNPLWNNIF